MARCKMKRCIGWFRVWRGLFDESACYASTRGFPGTVLVEGVPPIQAASGQNQPLTPHPLRPGPPVSTGGFRVRAVCEPVQAASGNERTGSTVAQSVTLNAQQHARRNSVRRPRKNKPAGARMALPQQHAQRNGGRRPPKNKPAGARMALPQQHTRRNGGRRPPKNKPAGARMALRA